MTRDLERSFAVLRGHAAKIGAVVAIVDGRIILSRIRAVEADCRITL